MSFFPVLINFFLSSSYFSNFIDSEKNLNFFQKSFYFCSDIIGKHICQKSNKTGDIFVYMLNFQSCINKIYKCLLISVLNLNYTYILLLFYILNFYFKTFCLISFRKPFQLLVAFVLTILVD